MSSEQPVWTEELKDLVAQAKESGGCHIHRYHLARVTRTSEWYWEELELIGDGPGCKKHDGQYIYDLAAIEEWVSICDPWPGNKGGRNG